MKTTCETSSDSGIEPAMIDARRFIQMSAALLVDAVCLTHSIEGRRCDAGATFLTEWWASAATNNSEHRCATIPLLWVASDDGAKRFVPATPDSGQTAHIELFLSDAWRSPVASCGG